MKNCGIELLPEAQKDIAEMLEYSTVTLCAPTAALKLYNVLLAQFQRLKSFPLSGKELEATNVPLNFLYRWKRVENYLVFYTIDVESKIANIMRVVYRYSNYLTILKKTELLIRTVRFYFFSINSILNVIFFVTFAA